MELLAARDNKSFFWNGNWLATLSGVLQVISAASPYRHDWTKIKSKKWLKVSCCKVWHFAAWEPGLNLTQTMVGMFPAAPGDSHTRMAFHGATKPCGAHCSASSSAVKGCLRKNTGQAHRVLCPGSLQHQNREISIPQELQTHSLGIAGVLFQPSEGSISGPAWEIRVIARQVIRAQAQLCPSDIFTKSAQSAEVACTACCISNVPPEM